MNSTPRTGLNLLSLTHGVGAACAHAPRLGTMPRHTSLAQVSQFWFYKENVLQESVDDCVAQVLLVDTKSLCCAGLPSSNATIMVNRLAGLSVYLVGV